MLKFWHIFAAIPELKAVKIAIYVEAWLRCPVLVTQICYIAMNHMSQNVFKLCYELPRISLHEETLLFDMRQWHSRNSSESRCGARSNCKTPGG